VLPDFSLIDLMRTDSGFLMGHASSYCGAEIQEGKTNAISKQDALCWRCLRKPWAMTNRRHVSEEADGEDQYKPAMTDLAKEDNNNHKLDNVLL
jgi:hypothetical protein